MINALHSDIGGEKLNDFNTVNDGTASAQWPLVCGRFCAAMCAGHIPGEQLAPRRTGKGELCPKLKNCGLS